jgi:hypothetical protein
VSGDPAVQAQQGAAGPRAALSRYRRHLATPRRPRLIIEIALIAVSYIVYGQIRNAVPDHASVAIGHAHQILDIERFLRIDVEHAVNHAVNSVTWLIVAMNYYYATLHFVITIGVLVWLYHWHPGRYRVFRTVLFVTTAVALVGFFLYALAPPRLLPGGDYIDTVLVHHTWGSLASGDLKQVSNQYAAMPSMHIGWSTWCGVTIFMLARNPWVRTAGLLYPVATLVVIVATGNHFVLDAVGGLLALAVGFGVQRLVNGRLAHRFPRYPADDPRSAPEAVQAPEPEPERQPVVSP